MLDVFVNSPEELVEELDIAHSVTCGTYEVTSWLREVTATGLAEGEGVMTVYVVIEVVEFKVG